MGNDFDTKIKVERFAEKLECDIDEIKRFISLINVEEDYRKKLNKGVKRLENKLEKIKKCTSLKEASKYIKLKKLNRDFGENNEWFRN